jgi:hypothetical protein
MVETMQQSEQEEPEIGLLREWLPKISGEYRAYLKGASEALLYAQEDDWLRRTSPPDTVFQE